MQDLQEIYALMLEADQSISSMVTAYGMLTYTILFLIIFIETGLIVVNFFPSDGLLFSAGILASSGELNLWMLLILLILATILGNSSNYFIARKIGYRFFKKERVSRNKLLHKAYRYYHKHQNKSIVLSRLFPVFRSFVPFIAGVTNMPFKQFNIYNIIGGVIWISIYLLMGFFFGNIPWVKENYGLILSIVLFAVIMVTVIGMIGFFVGQIVAKRN